MAFEQQEMSEKNKALKSKFTEMLDSALDYILPRRGEVREATILSIGENDMIVDLDGKRDGIIQPGDLDRVDEAYLEGLEVGDKVPVQVIKTSS
ncbi:MAG: S1 RNA-binding domain-containing protein, partial [Anaerolineae bacterium]